MRDTLHQVLKSRFLSVLLYSHVLYDLSTPTMTRIEHANGHKDYILEAESGRIELKGNPVILLRYDKDGNVVPDKETQAKQKIAKEAEEIGELILKHHEDKVLKSLLDSYYASVSDPSDEFIHLYEIRDALSSKFGNYDKARSALGNFSKTKWRDFGQICDISPLKQGRHRGKYDVLRDATVNELAEVRSIALDMIRAYLRYLEGG